MANQRALQCLSPRCLSPVVALLHQCCLRYVPLRPFNGCLTFVRLTPSHTERPVLFTIVTLFISGLVLRHRARWTTTNHRGQPLEVLRPPPNSPYRVQRKGARGLVTRGVDIVQRLNPPFRTMLVCLVARTLLFWYTLRKAQCSWRGLEVRFAIQQLLLCWYGH